jgi:hypothetical protein
MSMLEKLLVPVDSWSKSRLGFFTAETSFVAFLCCGMVLSIVLTPVQTARGSTLYCLNTNSSFEQGCFPPCECAIMIAEPMNGTFILTPTGFDGLFNNYAVTDVHWSVPINNANMIVTGSGTYKLGGEVALQQELLLDLQMDGGKTEHFDSGLVAPSAMFPDIKVTISTNAQHCFDTVFNVNASPTPVPQLHIGLASPDTVKLSWAVSDMPFALQRNSDLTMNNWVTVTNAPIIIDQENQIVLPLSPGDNYYRLQAGGS